MSSDELPTMMSNVPGSTTCRIARFQSARSRSVSVKDTVFCSPATRLTRANPRSALTGTATLATPQDALAYPGSVLVYALVGAGEVSVRRIYRQDWVGGTRLLLRIPRSAWALAESLPPLIAPDGRAVTVHFRRLTLGSWPR
jgi:hypothetical protein